MRLNPTAALKAVQSGIQRTLLNAEHIAGDLLDAFRNGPAVLRTQGESPEDEQIQSALGEIQFFVRHEVLHLLLGQEKIRLLLSKRKGK